MSDYPEIEKYTRYVIGVVGCTKTINETLLEEAIEDVTSSLGVEVLINIETLLRKPFYEKITWQEEVTLKVFNEVICRSYWK